MKVCHFNRNEAGVVVGDRVHPIGEALVKAGHVRSGYTMREVVDALANQPAATACAREAVGASASLPLGSVTLLAPILDPPSLWAAASNYRAHQAEMQVMSGGPDRSDLSFLSSIVTLRPGELITTGTPAGVQKLADGDTLRGRIDGVGTMELQVGAER